MAIRLEEMHPTLVHLPIALLPLAVVADWLGTTRDDDALRLVGRTAIRVAAVGAVAAASTGLVAGEQVNEGDAHEMLATHRNLNAAATITTLAMASWRSPRRASDRRRRSSSSRSTSSSSARRRTTLCASSRRCIARTSIDRRCDASTSRSSRAWPSTTRRKRRGAPRCA